MRFSNSNKAAIVTFVATLLIGLIPARASAQTVRGTVEDSLGVPLRDVRVSLIAAASDSLIRETRSGNTGEFSITLEAAGRFRVRLNRIGFAQQTTAAIQLIGNQIVTLRLTMHSAAATLAPVTVVERRNVTLAELMSSSGFDIRQAKYPMRAVTAEQFANEGITTLEDVILGGRFFGLQIIDDSAGLSLRLRAPPPAPGYCIAEVYLDGASLVEDSAQAEMALMRVGSITTDKLYGVEVYRGMQLPPPSLAGAMGTIRLEGSLLKPCGAVAVWTKAGRERALIAERAKKEGTSQVVRGMLVDFHSGLGIPNGVATLYSEFGAILEKEVQADSNGIFVFRTQHYGRLRVDASASGYVQLQTPVFQIDLDELLTIDVILDRTHRPIAPLAIRRREIPANYVATDFRGFGFRMRRSSGGTFFDSTAVARSGAATLGELVRSLPGVRVSSPSDSLVISFASTRTSGPSTAQDCNPMFFMNGELQRLSPAAVAGMSLVDVRAVEVFPAATEVPYVFRMGSTGCGVLGVWTR